MLKAILIDDEIHAVETLALILKKYCPTIDVVTATTDFNQAIQAINQLKPDILFLDIEMPQGSGFDLLEQITEKEFDIVFVTAHNHYAINAIKHNALDYILKPINIEEIIEAVKKIETNRNSLPSRESNTNILNLLQGFKSEKDSRISIATHTGIEFVNTEDIVYIEADGSYSTIYLLNNETIVASKNIMDFETALPATVFFRSHRSFLVNLSHVKRLVINDGYLEMKNGAKPLISRRRKDDFLEIMSK